MNANPQVTVIIPAFNAENSLRRAIDSVLVQTGADFRVIVVDDASTDNTVEVVESAARADTRIKLICQPENRGVSAARNVALKAAETEWVAFLDSDDEWLPSWGNVMIPQATAEVDVVLAGRLVVQPDGSSSPAASKALGAFSGEEACRLAMIDRLTPFPWDKLFRRCLFDDVQFAEGAARFEDMTANVLLYSLARRVISVADPVCRYYVSGQSLTWGRIPTMQEKMAAVTDLERAIDLRFRTGRFAGPYATMNVLMTVLVAQSAMVRGGASAEAAHTVTQCRDQITPYRLWATLMNAPAIGVAALLLRIFPRVYGVAYGMYVRRSYGIS